MRTFFVLIFISFKLIAFPIGDGKAMFSSDKKTIVAQKHQISFSIASLDEELNETEENEKSEKDSVSDIYEKSNSCYRDFFAFLIKQNQLLQWAYSPQSYSYQQLYRLYSNFRI